MRSRPRSAPPARPASPPGPWARSAGATPRSASRGPEPMTEREAMARAIDLAWRGWGRVQPNPLVGAVVLAGAEKVGEGWHAEYGGAHAEPAALASAGARARGGTLVCTLEPCAHQGKQPPCTLAIHAA